MDERVMRITAAAIVVPRQSEGSAIDRRPSSRLSVNDTKPIAGNHFTWTENASTRSVANQKFGVARPSKPATDTSPSVRPYGRRAAVMPSRTPRGTLQGGELHGDRQAERNIEDDWAAAQH